MSTLLAVTLLAHPFAIRPKFSWDFVGNMSFIHLCNESGLFNAEALDTIAKFPLVTIEKGQGFLDGSGRFAEAKIVEQLTAVKRADPTISTVFYMNSVLDWYFYEMHETFLKHPAWWLYDSNDPSQPVKCHGDSTFNPPKQGMLIFDHAKPEVRAFWQSVCASAVASGVVDGCFSDSSQPGSHATAKHLNMSYNAQFESGKVTTMANVTATFGGRAGAPYAGSTGVLIGKKPDQQGINAFQIEFFDNSEASIVELLAGVAKGYLVEAHTHVVDDMGCASPQMESVVAAFLIGAGVDSYFGSGAWISKSTLDVTQRWCPPLFERPLGSPLADAAKNASGVYARAFASGTKVFFDTRSNVGQIWWGGAPPAPAPAIACGPTCSSTLLESTTFANDDVGVAKAAESVEACCARCAGEPRCVQWAWHLAASGKWPRNACHLCGARALRRAHGGVTSGIMNRTHSSLLQRATVREATTSR